MAVHREYLKCDVCGTIIALRIRGGRLKQYPVRLYCGKCGILIDGKVILDYEAKEFSLDFHNASNIRVRPLPTPDFVIEVSGELLTDKMQACENGKLPENFSPFLKTMGIMEFEMMDNFIKSTSEDSY